jgi:hypothetical protein
LDHLLGSTEALEARERFRHFDWGHWNDGPPGDWVRLHTLQQVGSYISRFVSPRPGVYRLIGLSESTPVTPAVIDRVCGRDQTGTLYIGCENFNFKIRGRLAQMIQSVRAREYTGNHRAGRTMKHHPLLRERFPIEKLAVTWCYDRHAAWAEQELLKCYRRSFGELPPLNFRLG